MTTPTNAPVPGPLGAEHEGHLRRALGLPSPVMFGLVYIVPLTVFTTYGIVTQKIADAGVATAVADVDLSASRDKKLTEHVDLFADRRLDLYR